MCILWRVLQLLLLLLLLLRILLCLGVKERRLLLRLGIGHARHYEIGSHVCGGDVTSVSLVYRGLSLAGACPISQAGKGTAMWRLVVRRETVGVKDNGAGKREAQTDPKREVPSGSSPRQR